MKTGIYCSAARSIRAKLTDGRMLKIDNLLTCFVVSVSKALKIYSLLSSCSVATINKPKDRQPFAVYPSFSSDEREVPYIMYVVVVSGKG
jgi:hypothetical protein